MEYAKIIKNSANTVISNIFMYGISALIVTFGSMFLITSPPLSYGFIYMLVKGEKKEKIKLSYVFEGFQNGNFSRSWICMLLMIVIAVIFSVLGFVLAYILGFAVMESLDAMGFSKSIVIAGLISVAAVCLFIVTLPLILLVYVFPLLVVREYSPLEALRESMELAKTNLVFSAIIAAIVGLIILIGVLPYYIGFFLGLPSIINLFIYVAGILLTFPFSQQLLVSATMELIAE